MKRTRRFLRWSAPLVLAPVFLSSAARADVITDWNTVALNAIRTASTAPPVAARALAMMHAAAFDAVNAVSGGYNSYFYTGGAPAGASMQAAAAEASYTVLKNLFPTQQATFDAALNNSLAGIANGQSKTDGITLGVNVGATMMALRANDGASGAQMSWASGVNPGEWRPTGSGNALLPGWNTVTCFCMNSAQQFQLPGPPSLTSAAYAASLNQVKELGSINSATRTADQTNIAKFWADGAGTATPPGHWNRIAQTVAAQQGNTLVQNARLFALLNLGLADAGIACWDMKYTYDFWRPVTAIRLADTDGNALTDADPNWTPLLTTPPFPGYTSGHSLFSATAATILAGFFGTDNIAFTSTSEGNAPDRQMTSFSQAAAEAGVSRIYGGIHFDFDDANSQMIGRGLGAFVLGGQLVAAPEPTSLSLLAVGLTGVVCRLRRRSRPQRAS